MPSEHFHRPQRCDITIKVSCRVRFGWHAVLAALDPDICDSRVEQRYTKSRNGFQVVSRLDVLNVETTCQLQRRATQFACASHWHWNPRHQRLRHLAGERIDQEIGLFHHIEQRVDQHVAVRAFGVSGSDEVDFFLIDRIQLHVAFHEGAS